MSDGHSLTALTIGLPSWLREDAKREAQRRGMTLWALCRAALERELQEGLSERQEESDRDGRIDPERA
jgi:hypothetical protein